jgi:hypothetical protein
MDWQQAAALAIVAAAFLWLLRRPFLAHGKNGACGTCSHAARPASPPQLVQLDAPREKAEAQPPAPEEAKSVR